MIISEKEKLILSFTVSANDTAFCFVSLIGLKTLCEMSSGIHIFNKVYRRLMSLTWWVIAAKTALQARMEGDNVSSKRGVSGNHIQTLHSKNKQHGSTLSLSDLFKSRI